MQENVFVVVLIFSSKMKYSCQLHIPLSPTNALLQDRFFSIKCFQILPFSGTGFPPASVLLT